MFDAKLNHPPHTYLDEFYYFITVTSRIDNAFDTDAKKYFIYSSIAKALKKYNYSCQSWVILKDHYQLVIKSKRGKDLGSFIRYINGRSANLLLHDFPHLVGEKVELESGRLRRILEPDFGQQDGQNQGAPRYYNKVWYQYWDTPLEASDDIWGCITYNHINPIKHGYVKSLFELPSYKWSSYKDFLNKYGFECMMEMFERYAKSSWLDK